MIIYLHGFNSAGLKYNNKRILGLADGLADNGINDFIAPTYETHNPKVSIPFLEKIIESHYTSGKLVLIGTSLGGYYARYLSDKYHISCILTNPSLEPEKTLTKYLGINRNFVTNEPYIFNDVQLGHIKEYDMSGNKSPYGTMVLLNEGDEVLDYNIAAHEFANQGKIIIYPGGGHRFNYSDEVIKEISKFYYTVWG